MTGSERVRFRVSWILLLLNGLAILAFGIVVVLRPTPDTAFLRAIGVASIGMGLFGAMLTLTAFRRRERWAFVALWYYPLFWTAHLVGNLPPGNDHIHQVVFIVLSLAGLVVCLDSFFPRPSRNREGRGGFRPTG
jgi:uncharacterized membrane protein HdeD (DUF308 family)